MGEQLWKQCAVWLENLDVLPPDHNISRLEDLVYTLRDGVVLCNIIATMDSTALDLKSVNHRPQMAKCLCLKNIRIFLQSCKEFFGLKDSDLFEPSMLYDYTDFGKVILTLSKFSRSTKVRNLSNLGGFPTSNSPKAKPEEEQIYQRLQAIVNDDTYEQFYYTHHGGGTSNYAYCRVGGCKSK